MIRRTCAVIDLGALRHNLQKVREYAPRARVMAAIKANAYGHGSVQVARRLEDADAFAVATLAEATVLRDAGINKPIVLLGGVLDSDALYLAAERDLQVVIHDYRQLIQLEQAACAKTMSVWVKLDTGMHRLGFDSGDVPEVQKRLATLKPLRVQGWMTHLASADDVRSQETATQLERFTQALGDIKTPRSIANSAGIVAWPQTHADWVRPGITLYGASPLPGRSADDLGLRPVMTLNSHLLSIRKLEKGDHVGYSGTWIAPQAMRMGVVAIGYGDGYPRHAPSGTPVLLNGRRTTLIGRVSMDLICVDLRGHDDAREGDTVVLWGEGLPADEVARSAGTIAYELFCDINRRVEFEYRN